MNIASNVNKNKIKLRDLLIKNKWLEAKELLLSINEKDKRNRIVTFEYWHFEKLIMYKNKSKDQWLRDMRNTCYYDDVVSYIIDSVFSEGYDKALNLIDEAIRYSPTNTNLYDVKAIIYFYKDQLENFFEIIESNKLEKLRQFEEKVHDLVEKTGNYNQAIKLIDDQLKDFPDDHLALAYKGVAFYKQGNQDKAITFLKKSISSKLNRYALYHLFEISKEQRNFSDSVKFLTLLIPIVEREIEEKEKASGRKGEEISISDIWMPVNLIEFKFERAKALNLLGDRIAAKDILLDIKDSVDNKWGPLWDKASDRDPDYIVDAYEGGYDTPNRKMAKIYDNTMNLLGELDPQFKLNENQNLSKGCFGIIFIICISLLTIL